MDETTPTPHLPEETFLVFQFALAAPAPGLPLQRVRRLGEFAAADEAFEIARLHAGREAVLLASALAPAGSSGRSEGSVVVIPTEWGYDVKRDHQTLARFWVHTHPVRVD